MDNKIKIGALLLAATVGGAAVRLAAAPIQPDVRLVSVTVDPVVALNVVVNGRIVRLQCTDADGPAVKLAGLPFAPANDLCAAGVKFAADSKASVGLMVDSIAQQLAAK